MNTITIEVEPNEIDLLIEALASAVERLEDDSCAFNQVRRRKLIDRLLVAKHRLETGA